MAEQNIITGCWDEDCLMCSGEACNLCGAGCWSNVKNCEHDVLERHEEPERIEMTTVNQTNNTTTEPALEACQNCGLEIARFGSVWYHVAAAKTDPNGSTRCALIATPVSSASAAPTVDAKPIDMILFCPRCGTQHVDAPEDDTSFRHRMEAFGLVAEPQDSFPTRWTNPPHRSHLCHQCGAVWRPADVHTNGSAQIRTRGERDNTWTNSEALPATAPPAAPQDEAEIDSAVAYPCVVDEKTLFACLQTAEQTFRKPDEPIRLERFRRTKAKLYAQAKASHAAAKPSGAARKVAVEIANDRLGPRSDSPQFWDKYVAYVKGVVEYHFPAAPVAYERFPALLTAARSKNTNPKQEWYEGWNAALEYLAGEMAIGASVKPQRLSDDVVNDRFVAFETRSTEAHVVTEEPIITADADAKRESK